MVSEKAPDKVWIGWPRNSADDMWFHLEPEVGNAVEYVPKAQMEEAIAAEREKCARVAEDFYKPMRYRVNPLDVANAIRSQGSTQDKNSD